MQTKINAEIDSRLQSSRHVKGNVHHLNVCAMCVCVFFFDIIYEIVI